MKKWRCTACSYIYDPAVGDPDNGVPAGTAFEAIPDDWVCPVCGVGKDMFEEVADEGGPSTGSGSPQRNAGPPRA